MLHISVPRAFGWDFGQIREQPAVGALSRPIAVRTPDTLPSGPSMCYMEYAIFIKKYIYITRGSLFGRMMIVDSSRPSLPHAPA